MRGLTVPIFYRYSYSVILDNPLDMHAPWIVAILCELCMLLTSSAIKMQFSIKTLTQCNRDHNTNLCPNTHTHWQQHTATRWTEYVTVNQFPSELFMRFFLLKQETHVKKKTMQVIKGIEQQLLSWNVAICQHTIHDCKKHTSVCNFLEKGRYPHKRTWIIRALRLECSIIFWQK